MDNGSETGQLRREVGELRAQVRAIRSALLRFEVVFVVVLIGAGSLVPVWSETVDGEPRTVRVLTAGFALSGNATGGVDVALGIGFLGLLLSLVVLCGLLVSTVFGELGPAEWAWMRGLVLALAVIGAVVAVLLSLIAYGSDESDVSGGAGAIVVLLGLAVSSLVVRQQAWKDAGD